MKRGAISQGDDEINPKRGHVSFSESSRKRPPDALEDDERNPKRAHFPESRKRLAAELENEENEPFFDDDYDDIYKYVPDAPVADEGVDFDEIVLDSVAMAHQSVLDYYKQQAAIKKSQLAPQTRHDRIKFKNISDNTLKGTIRVNRIRSLLNDAFIDDMGRPIRRSEPQHDVHEAYIRACLPKIYEEEWDDNREAIMERYEIDRLQMWVLVVMARREGKTWGMAMFIAAMILSIPDTEISIFATCKRTAGKLLKVFHKFLMKAIDYLGDEEWIVASKNAEQIIVVGPDGTERIIGCYPASVR